MAHETHTSRRLNYSSSYDTIILINIIQVNLHQHQEFDKVLPSDFSRSEQETLLAISVDNNYQCRKLFSLNHGVRAMNHTHTHTHTKHFCDDT